jgi:hypothetical protein
VDFEERRFSEDDIFRFRQTSSIDCNSLLVGIDLFDDNLLKAMR